MNLDETDDLGGLFVACGKEVGIVFGTLNLNKIVNDLSRLDIRAEERQKVIEDQFNLEIRQGVEQEPIGGRPALPTLYFQPAMRRD